jgi:hypothetical protein
MRKHLGWYCKGFPHAASLRAAMGRASSSSDVERLLAEYQEPVPVVSDDVASYPSKALLPFPLSCV